MKAPAFTLEALLMNRGAFGLETASPLQRAICRIADGASLEELAAHPDVAQANWGRRGAARRGCARRSCSATLRNNS
jgi:hypothetical protein